MSQLQKASSDVSVIRPSPQFCPVVALGADVAKWSNAWLEIDSTAFEQNIERLRSHVRLHVEICATMKADAYRHGIDLLMPSIIRMGVPAVGVSSNAEGLLVRRSGFKGRLLRLRTASLPEMVEGFQFGFEEILGSAEVADMLSCAARLRGAVTRIHLAINSGQMGRSDIETRTEKGRDHALAILKTRGLSPAGIMTHFALEDPLVLKQQAFDFQEDAEWLVQAAGLHREAIVFHAANSNALMEVPETHFDMVRPGRVLYGYSNHPKFARLMTFKSRVTAVNEYRANTGVTYNHTYVLQRDSRLANIPVGYADSHRKEYTGGDVLIRGHRVPIVGAITMNSLMVDVTDFPDIEHNDEVVLYGRQENEAIWGAEIQKYIQESMVEMTTRWSVNPKVLASFRSAT
ncbi:alanine racemase [Variovorax boronicumulans]